MATQRITDWDDAYANMPYIPGADDYIPRWLDHAADFRSKVSCELDVPYGQHARETYDVFHPPQPSKGLFFFVHGGYWMRFDKSHWSHFAAGALERGYTVCMPSYPLCPEVAVGDIIGCVTKAAAQIGTKTEGPIILSGHSAGGHLVSMLSTRSFGLADPLSNRIERTVSISGVHDLRPLLKTQLNETLKLNYEQAAQWSPVLLQPIKGLEFLGWVGAAERPEFVRQNRSLTDVWLGLGASIQRVEDAGKHHFDVIDGLRDPNSPLMQTIFED